MHTEDPRLTAYALDELEPAERAEVEALLQTNPAAAQEVAEMRELASLVRRHLSTEEAPPLAPQQRSEILSEATGPQLLVLPRNNAAPRRRQVWMPVAVAACAAVLAGSSVLYYEEHTPRKNTVGMMQDEARKVTDSDATLKDAEDKSEVLTADAPAAASPVPLGLASSAPPATVPHAIVDAQEHQLRVSNGELAAAPATPMVRALLPTDPSPSPAAPIAPFAGAAPAAKAEAPAPGNVRRFGVLAAKPQEQAGSGKGAPAKPGQLADARQAADGFATTRSLQFGGTTEVNGGILKMPVAEPVVEKGKALDAKVAAAHQPALKQVPASAAQPLPPGAPEPARPTSAPTNEGLAKAGGGRALFSSADKAKDGVATFRPQSNALKEVAGEKRSTSEVAPAPTGELGHLQNAAPATAAPMPNREEENKAGHREALETQRLRLTEEKSKALKQADASPDPTKLAKFDQLSEVRRENAEQDADGRGAGLGGVAAPLQKMLAANGTVAATPPVDDAPTVRKDLGLLNPTPVVNSPEQRLDEKPNTDAYESITENPFLQVLVRGNETSTFSIDVDTASYSNVRRMLTAGERPPKGAVRIEEMVNYFRYDYPEPKAGDPMSVTMDVAGCPWTPEHRLLRIGLKARELDQERRPEANLIFLLDVSGSMEPENRLPLVKKSLRLLVEKLGTNDTVGIVVYAGASGTVLEPTNDKAAILAALDKLSAGGSTNGAAGIQLAYDLAAKRFQKDRTNRVILATDGDFNVGTTSEDALVGLIQKKAKSGVFLTLLGVGHGNLKDTTMEKLADRGNGNYAYLDTIAEGRKVLVEQMAGTLVTVAKDVKMQIEFNPVQVGAYRLIGYEKRMLAKEDFNDDTKDAGEIGAGHTVTALYEIVPAGQPIPGDRETTQVDPLKYQLNGGAFIGGNKSAAASVDPRRYDNLGRAAGSASALADLQPPFKEMLTLKLAWKAPEGDVSVKREFPLTDTGVTLEKSSQDFRWAAAVASFGMLLRDSPYKGQATWTSTRALALESQGKDPDGHRIEFLDLIGKAEAVVK